jgi:putative selenium metabolism hydrolase
MTHSDIQEELVSLLKDFVQISSFSGKEEKLAQRIKKAMEDTDFDEVRIDAFGSVIARKAGKIPGKTLLFDAHMDVVPVNIEEWTHDPFGGEISGGKLWGRGSSDNKGSLASIVSAIGSLRREEFSGTIFVTATIGEEVLEGASLRKILEEKKVDGVIIGEPTDCRLGIGQKGRAKFIVHAFGKPAHSANPEKGDNAVYRSANMIQAIQNMALHTDQLFGSGVMELIDIISSPYPSLSTLPYDCRMSYDRRLLPGETLEGTLNEYRSALAQYKDKCSIEIEQVSFKTYTGKTIESPDFHPAWLMSVDGDWVKKGLQGLKLGGVAPEYYGVPYCSNGSASAGEMGIPSLVFGPSNIHLAHAVDEYIEIAELLKSREAYVGLAKSIMDLPI